MNYILNAGYNATNDLDQIDVYTRSCNACDARLVTGPGPASTNPPTVRVFPPAQGADPQYEYAAYGATGYGVNVSCGDVNGDGLDEVLTGAGPGAIYGPHVRGFAVDGTPLPGLSFLAYGTNKWGVNVAAGDLDGDGDEEVVTGAGPGPVFGPHVRAFDYTGSGTSPVAGVSYFAYGTLKWGVNVSSGDIDGDGYAEIVTAPGPGAVFGPHIRGWDVDGGTATAMSGVSFFCYGTNRWGARVSCGDVDGDGIAEMVTAPGPGAIFGSQVRGWNYDGGSVAAMGGINFFAWQTSEAMYGARVYAGVDLDADGRHDMVLGPGPDPTAGAWIKVFGYNGTGVTELFSIQAFDESLTKGTSVSAGVF
jgi:hypothetical protein